MTIAVAAPFPWGFARKALRSFSGATLHKRVILAADSRWTYGDRPPDDMGQKLWKLAPKHGIGAVFAGDVRSAEEALETCQRRLDLLARPAPGIVADVISVALDQVYAAHQAKRLELGPLYVLVGIVGADSGASIIRLSSDDHFRPHVEHELQVIGWPSACETLLAKLAEKDEEFLQGDIAWKIDVQEWALRLAGTLFTDIIEPNDEATVGGGVQIAIVGPDGWKDLTVARLGLVDIESSDWKLISEDPERVQRFRRQFDLPPLADGHFDLGFVSLADAATGTPQPRPARAGKRTTRPKASLKSRTR